MKSLGAALLPMILVLLISLFCSHSYGVPESRQDRKIDLWLIFRLRDYRTDMPISNVSVVAGISTSWGDENVGPAVTNKTGIIQVFLGNYPNMSFPERPTLLDLSLSKNYTLIKVHDLFLEDAEYVGEYAANCTRYTQMKINLDQKNVRNSTFIEGTIWVLKGKLVKVSEHDPFTGERKTLSMKPAVKAVVEKVKRSEYEGYYFFPLDYDVTIVHEVESKTDKSYQPIRIVVKKNTTLINWMHHAAKEYVSRETLYMSRDIGWLSSSGFTLDREMEEYQAIRNLLNRVLDFYEKGEYGPAFGGARISASRLSSLKTWLSNLKTYALLSTLGISLFAYGLASLLPSFFFEEPSENKIRLISKVLIFSSLMLVFSLTHPSLRIAYAIFIERVTGVETSSIDLPISLLGCFIVGSAVYFFITLISIMKTPMTDLALQLGVRSLKRRLSRTILTLITITIIVSSAIIFVNISVSRATRIKESWRGTDTPGVMIKPDVSLVPLSEYDINWTREQEWCKDLGYREEIRRNEYRAGVQLLRIGVLLSGDRRILVDVVGVDPAFMEKQHNLSKYVRGFWQDFSVGKPVIIIPTSYEIPTNEYVKVAVEEFIMQRGIPVPLGTRTFGQFRVVGKFDPAAVSKLTKIDGNPLFENTLKLVLVPVKAIVDPAIAISEATILTDEKTDPVELANELAYMMGIATIANKGGLAARIEWSLELSATGFIPYLVPLTIVALMVYVTMASVYEERKREFTILATLGLDPRNTFQVFIVETFLLGLMGTFFGFFGTYIFMIASFYSTSFLGLHNVPTLSLSYAHWSMPAILVALFTGVVMVFLGGYVPAVRAQGLSLMGRMKRRQLVGELISDKSITRFTLPIRETVQNCEMLYGYIRETIGNIKSSLVDPHSVKGDIRGDGAFTVSFIASGFGQDVFVPCEVKGTREEESLVPIIEFPTAYRDYGRIREIIRDLEEHMIGFSAWKEMQLKMKIVREAPRRRKTLEEVLAEIRDVISQIKDCNKKLKILDAQKGQLSEEIYGEFRQKYAGIVEEKSKGLRSMAIILEPYLNELQEEIKKTEVEVERIAISYNLGEISEEEYVKIGGPSQGKLAMLKSKVKELEEVFQFLEKPLGTVWG